ncbi:hypothetical protein [Formosa sp. Hel1_33_131]|uniref:hypothetical protein n=1 Tax=Formosa sp. Hel1_33_131 TaxID=1336794 RepID=UPI00084E1785|nr:hypothetical protein [Formosa sp. Hel1_33_131]
MYENYNNILGVNQTIFYQELAMLSYDNFQKWVQRGKLNRLRTKGRGRTGLIEFSSIPEEIKQLIIKKFGNPYLENDRATFTNQLEQDQDAIDFFKSYRYNDGSGIPTKKQHQYICEAELLNLYISLISNYGAKMKASSRKANKGALQAKISAIINDIKSECYPNTSTKKYPHKLPTNPRALNRKAFGTSKSLGYEKAGFEFLVHKNANNKAAQKIKGDIAKWLLAQYSMPNKIVVPVLHAMYEREALKRNWCELSENAIYKWLHEPTQERQWMISRDGMETFRNKYGHKLVRDKDTWFPNSYWAIDGSKIDWLHYYDNTLGMAAKLKIDIVIDVYSEKIIGTSFSETENHEDHFRAVKMAFQEAQAKPFLFTYDGQSGHKTSRMQGLYGKMVAKKGGTHYQHAVGRHSSPVEQVFGRFQQQILNQWWFSDKQSIKARTDNSKPNIDFLLENKHRLLTREKLIEAFKISVNEWNNAKHPKFNETRNEVYNHEPIMQEKMNYLDMIDLFWIYTNDTITYKADGIKVQIANKKYHFEVYDANDNVDLRFRERYVGSKFFVKYDPDQLDNYVSLYAKLPNGDTKFIADAQPVHKQQQIPALMTEGDKAQFAKDYEVRKVEEAKAKKQMEQIQRETGITPEQLIEDQEFKIKMGGKLPKKERNAVEAASVFDLL